MRDFHTEVVDGQAIPYMEGGRDISAVKMNCWEIVENHKFLAYKADDFLYYRLDIYTVDTVWNHLGCKVCKEYGAENGFLQVDTAIERNSMWYDELSWWPVDDVSKILKALVQIDDEWQDMLDCYRLGLV